MMDNCTYCVLNGPRMYPMEKQLRSLAKADGSYVVTVFDCCREKLAIGPTRGLSQDLLNEDCFNVDEWIG